MWIIPSNLPLSSRSALEFLESSEDLKELASIPVSWPTWKSKPTSVQTWLRAWKRVYWIQHLFGRTLKPSMHDRFVEEYTASLEVIHAPENPEPGYEKGIYIKDSFGRLFAKRLQQADLFGAFSRTWMTTLRERIRSYKEAYAIWVTELRRDYIQRVKLVRHMKGQGYSSLPANSYSHGYGAGAGQTTGQGRKDESTKQRKEWNEVLRQWMWDVVRNSSKELGNRVSQRLEVGQQQPTWEERTAIKRTSFDLWPAGQGYYQHDWEESRTIKPGLGCTIDGYNFREDLLRALGNSVVEQTAELAFIDLMKKHLKNL